MKLIEKVRKFLKDNQIDYLLVNSTNEFLAEYTPLEENSRYFLTGFSGSTGDALISQKDIFLFVDGRYHEQADLQVDKTLVNVVKLKAGAIFASELAAKIAPGKTLAIVSKKVSQARLEILQTKLKDKKIEIKLLDFDPVHEPKAESKNQKTSKIDEKITGMSSEEKINKISKKLKAGEAILVTDAQEISYILNLRDFSTNYSSAIKGKYIVTNEGCFEFEKFNLKNAKTVYVDKATITAFDYALLGAKAKPLKKNYIKEMKSVKTKEEIEHYKKCFERTDKALLATRKFIEENENISEYDIEKNLEENFYKYGAKSLSFKSIVAKDKNAAQAHYSQSSKTEILKEGSLVLIDCGAYYEGGYATDITRVFVKGKPSKLQKTVYTVVLKGFLKAFRKKITPETTGYDMDRTARRLIDKNKPTGFGFSHSLGHGIGISVHEAPPYLAFSPVAKTPLKVNMCFTIEPGLYNPKHFGVRLENSCYLAKGGKCESNFVIKSFTNMCFEEKLIDFDLLTPTEKKQLNNFSVK